MNKSAHTRIMLKVLPALPPNPIQLRPNFLHLQRLQPPHLLPLPLQLLLLPLLLPLPRLLPRILLPSYRRLDIARVRLDRRRVRLLEAEVVRALEAVDDLLEVGLVDVGVRGGLDVFFTTGGVAFGVGRVGLGALLALVFLRGRDLLVGRDALALAVHPAAIEDVAVR